jgi:hypothetical protein
MNWLFFLVLIMCIGSGSLLAQYQLIDLTTRYNLPWVDADPVGYYYSYTLSGNPMAMIAVFYPVGGKIYYFQQPLSWNLFTPVIELIAKTGSTPSKGPFHAYIWPAGMTSTGQQEVVYIDRNSHVMRLYKARLAPVWHKQDLTGISGAPLALDGIVGFVSSVNQTNYVFYRDQRNQLHALTSNKKISWEDTNLTTSLIGAVPSKPGYKLSAFSWEGDPLVRIAYLGSDQHIHTIGQANGRWEDKDLTLGFSTLPAGAPFGLGVNSNHGMYIIYPGQDGHIHAYYYNQHIWWMDIDITVASNEPNLKVAPLKQLSAFSRAINTSIVILFPDAATKHLVGYTYYGLDYNWVYEDYTDSYRLPMGGKSIYGAYPGGLVDDYFQYFLYKGINQHAYLARGQ